MTKPDEDDDDEDAQIEDDDEEGMSLFAVHAASLFRLVHMGYWTRRIRLACGLDVIFPWQWLPLGQGAEPDGRVQC
jgi:hypothetical protein